ncbi:Mss4-like protein [Hyaloraphidium curvatum]|nr:Mss4-like protein [Hyaloraphidium curvatum]
MADDASAATRTARCHCGRVTIVARGAPGGINACSCHSCQRTSGSALTYSAFYPVDRVAFTSGKNELKEYKAVGDAGREFRTRFCGNCGTPVCRELDVLPGVLGIFVGTFGDAGFPKPEKWYHTVSRHAWLGPAEGVEDVQTQ